MLLKGEVYQPRDCITNVINLNMWLLYDSDVTFWWSPAQDKCGHVSALPIRVKPNITA